MSFLIWRSYSEGKRAALGGTRFATSLASRLERIPHPPAIPRGDQSASGGLAGAASHSYPQRFAHRPSKARHSIIPQLKAPKHVGARAERAKEAEQKVLGVKQDTEHKAHRDKLMQKLFSDGQGRSATPSRLIQCGTGMSRLIGVHARIDLITKREKLGGDRKIGEALYHLRTNDFCCYDLEVDTSGSAA